MRRPWLFALACVLTTALAYLGTLQVRWINAVSAAEAAAARRAMEVAAKQFAEEMSRETARVILAFQLATLDPEQIARRYAEWSVLARDRRFLQAVYVAAPDGALAQLDVAARALRPVPWPAALLPLRASLSLARAGRLPIEPDFSIVVVPLHPPREHAPRPGVLIAQVDRAYLTGVLFPELARHNRDFDMALADHGRIIWRSLSTWPQSIDDAAELSMPLMAFRRTPEPRL